MFTDTPFYKYNDSESLTLCLKDYMSLSESVTASNINISDISKISKSVDVIKLVQKVRFEKETVKTLNLLRKAITNKSKADFDKHLIKLLVSLSMSIIYMASKPKTKKSLIKAIAISSLAR